MSRGDPVTRSLRGAIVTAALAGASIALLVAAIVATIALGRLQHSTLDAASSVVRGVVADTDAPRTARELATLGGALTTWGVSAAAFDRNGVFSSGDGRLRADGLAAGRAPAPPRGRQLAIVGTRDGYVLLVNDPTAIARLRVSALAGLGLTSALVFGAAWFVGGRWGRARARSAGRISAGLAMSAQTPAAIVIVHDPLFGELSSEVAAAVERLSRSLVDRAAGEDRLRAFLAEAAHELRTPLAIAIGYVGILGRGAIGDAELAARIVRDVAAEHARLQQLVERILHLARLDAVARDPTAAADVERIVAEAIALVRPLDIGRAIEVEAGGAPWAAIAPDELRDALRNVLENAIRYAPQAPIRVRVATEHDTVVVRVIDAGPGMDSWAAAHAFDRFFRGVQRGDVTGSGLGLAIVRRIAQRSGGAATLTSVPGSGTTVELRFPRAAVNADHEVPFSGFPSRG